MFTPDVRETLSTSWNLPEPISNNQQSSETQKWFEAHRKHTRLDAHSFGKSAQKIGKGMLVTGGIGLLALPFFPGVAVAMGLTTVFFGTGSFNRYRKKQSYAEQHRIVKQNYKIWRACKADVAYLQLLKNDIQLQRKQIQDASESDLAEVTTKIEEKWKVLRRTIDSLSPTLQVKAAGLRGRGRKVIMNVKKLSSAIGKKDTHKRIERQKEIILIILSECTQSDGEIDQLIERRHKCASRALYKAVQIKEADTREFHSMHLHIDEAPNWVTDGRGQVREL